MTTQPTQRCTDCGGEFSAAICEGCGCTLEETKPVGWNDLLPTKWKLVPEFPTPTMQNAAMNAYIHDDEKLYPDHFDHVWEAMLENSPTINLREAVERVVREIHQDGFLAGIHGQCAFRIGHIDKFVNKIMEAACLNQ